jgi:NADH-quinone oxidoreductase subunit K
MTPQLENSLLIGAVLFVLGIIGFLTRRNLIVMFLSAELMLQAVALNLIAFSYAWGNYHGQAFTVFVLTVAACEAAIALVLFLAVYRHRRTLDVSSWYELGESPPPAEEIPGARDTEPVEPQREPDWPELTPAGREPVLSAGASKQLVSDSEGAITHG